MREAASILLVDDDDALRERLARALRSRGHDVWTACDHESALAMAGEVDLDHAVIDLRMPGPSGLEVVRDLGAAAPGIAMLVLTGYGSISTAVDAVRLGAVGYLQKPATADQILAAFERATHDPLEEPDAPDYEPPSLGRAEWEHIQRVLVDCGGNVSKAARVLGLHRRTLQRKLAKFPPRS